jgi:YidC/Oxa1 family membrane protein insertase
MTMPPPANEQAEMQQKMMKYMMVFIGLMFYKVASGLCLYFIASSLWGVAERKLLPKARTPGSATDEASSAAVPKRPRSGGPNGNSTPKRKPPKARRRK